MEQLNGPFMIYDRRKYYLGAGTENKEQGAEDDMGWLNFRAFLGSGRVLHHQVVAFQSLVVEPPEGHLGARGVFRVVIDNAGAGSPDDHGGMAVGAEVGCLPPSEEDGAMLIQQPLEFVEGEEMVGGTIGDRFHVLPFRQPQQLVGDRQAWDILTGDD